METLIGSHTHVTDTTTMTTTMTVDDDDDDDKVHDDHDGRESERRQR